MAIKLHSSFAVHPGVWLRAEVVEPAGLSVTEMADKLRVTRQAMSNLLNGKSGLSAEMAIRFEEAFGLKAETLIRMEGAHDLAVTRARVRNACSSLDTGQSNRPKLRTSSTV